MNNVQFRDLAPIGAQTRLAALDTEREAILKSFPTYESGSNQRA
jgi:hypothetical protein